MWTCNQLDLQRLGSQPIMPKNLPHHCSSGSSQTEPPVGLRSRGSRLDGLDQMWVRKTRGGAPCVGSLSVGVLSFSGHKLLQYIFSRWIWEIGTGHDFPLWLWLLFHDGVGDQGPLHTRDWEPVTIITLQALSLVEKAEPVVQARLHSLFEWGTSGVCEECKMDVKSTWIPTWHLWMDHGLWSLGLFSKTTSSRVGLTQHREIMALRTLTKVGLFYFYHVRRPTWTNNHWNSIWLRAPSHMTSHYTWGSVTTLHETYYYIIFSSSPPPPNSPNFVDYWAY